MECYYNGDKYDSKVEARVGAFLHESGFEVRRQVELRIDDGGNMLLYHADFYLPNLDYYIEVKSNYNSLFAERDAHQNQSTVIAKMLKRGTLGNGIMVISDIFSTYQYKPDFNKLRPMYLLYKRYIYHGCYGIAAKFAWFECGVFNDKPYIVEGTDVAGFMPGFTELPQINDISCIEKQHKDGKAELQSYKLVDIASKEDYEYCARPFFGGIKEARNYNNFKSK